jgi:hypothetical protein
MGNPDLVSCPQPTWGFFAIFFPHNIRFAFGHGGEVPGSAAFFPPVAMPD